MKQKTPEIVDAVRPLMAQALADAVGATKRRVQLWTDAGALHCFPETDRRGRGHQRLYPRSELPFAAVAQVMAENEIRVWLIAVACNSIRAEMADRFGNTKYARWCKSAWSGKTDSYFLFGPPPSESFGWMPGEKLMDLLHAGRTGIVIPVHTVISPFVE